MCIDGNPVPNIFDEGIKLYASIFFLEVCTKNVCVKLMEFGVSIHTFLPNCILVYQSIFSLDLPCLWVEIPAE